MDRQSGTVEVLSLVQISVQAIEDLIANGSLSSGDRINESHLAERLGISRGPIREACRSLEKAGLLVSIPNRGTFVRTQSVDETRDLYIVRSVLAGLAGRLVAEIADDAVIAHLAALVGEMDAAVNDRRVEDYFRLNLQFHSDLVEAADNPTLAEAYLRIVKQLLLTRRRGLVDAGNIAVSNNEHRAIVACLKARDADGAEDEMRRHVTNGLARLFQIT